MVKTMVWWGMMKKVVDDTEAVEAVMTAMCGEG